MYSLITYYWSLDNMFTSGSNSNELGSGCNSIIFEFDECSKSNELSLISVETINSVIKNESIDFKEATSVITSYGGGGTVLNSNSKVIIPDYNIRDGIEKLARGLTPHRKRGRRKWDNKKIMSDILLKNFMKIPARKYVYKPKNTYFIVDTSGSVWHFASFIIDMIRSCTPSNNIHVWSGNEAHPNKNEKTGIDYGYSHYFHDDVDRWIDRIKPPDGSSIVFWGDLLSINIKPKETIKLLSKFNTIWLHSEKKGDTNKKYYTSYDETNVGRKVFDQMLFNISSKSKLINAINSIC